MSNQPARANRWIEYVEPRPGAQKRLFCLPYSGAGASIYRPWARNLPSALEVCPIQLPGREQRFREKPFYRVGPLVAALREALWELLDMPFAVFGYSMGAAIAFELGRQLREEGHRGPEELILAARSPPHVEDASPVLHRLDDRALREELRKFGGAAEKMIDTPELAAILLPTLRADLELNETYSIAQRPLIDCSLTVLGGVDDKRVAARDLEAWGELTTGSCQVKLFPGGHFFIDESTGAILSLVSETLLGRREPAGGWLGTIS